MKQSKEKFKIEAYDEMTGMVRKLMEIRRLQSEWLKRQIAEEIRDAVPKQ